MGMARNQRHECTTNTTFIGYFYSKLRFIFVMFFSTYFGKEKNIFPSMINYLTTYSLVN